MKKAVFWGLGLSLFSQISWAQKVEPLPLTIAPLEAPTLSEETLKNNVDMLNNYIGSYPPRIENAEQRKQIYTFWLEQVAEAEAFAKANPSRESAFSLRSDLYRQGHNMDVAGAADRAQENLALCFAKFDNPINCHFSASYFYLSIGPQFVDKAKPSLDALREHYKEEGNFNVDRGFVFYYIYKGDVSNATKEAEAILAKYPDTQDKKLFEALVNGDVKVQVVGEDGPNE